MTPPSSSLVDSIRARLRNVAGPDGARYQSILERYAIERLLYRLARSPLRERFVLKGATLFLTWGGDAARPTRDLDFLGYGTDDVDDLIAAFRAIATTTVEADGLVFLPDAIHGARIKAGQKYEGVRLGLVAMLGKIRIPLQVDVGFGDAVVPAPLEGLFPTLLDLPAPYLRLYPREVVVAEKFQALVALGMANTRMKDFYDLWTLSRSFDFDGYVLANAFRATFDRRETTMPDGLPTGLGEAFARQADGYWRAFLRKGMLPAADLGTEVLPAIATFLMPIVDAVRHDDLALGTWSAGGPWRR